ncbi:MAG: metallophosphoesterase [Myxococcales bacterium]
MGSMEAGLFRTAIVGLLVAGVTGLGLSAVVRVAWARIRRKLVTREMRLWAVGFGGLFVVELGCFAWAVFVEPGWLEVTHLEVKTPLLAAGKRLRIVHFSDTHIDGPSAVIDSLPERVAKLKPDLIVFTGDAATEDEDLEKFRAILRQMPAPLGRYLVRGNHETWRHNKGGVFGDAGIELVGRAVTTPGGELTLCGAVFGFGERLDDCLRAAPEDRPTLVAYHSPDLVEDLAPFKPTLYLAGHTHGGQIRMPFFGALVTLSKFDKKYEMGEYRVGETTLYVNRGVGFEPRPAPAIRFLCRPELALIELVGTR